MDGEFEFVKMVDGEVSRVIERIESVEMLTVAYDTAARLKDSRHGLGDAAHEIEKLIDETDGIATLRDLCDDAGGMTAAWLLEQRRTVAEHYNLHPTKVKNMPVSEFAGKLDAMWGGKQRTTPNEKRVPVNAKMIDTLQKNPESRGWTSRQWATHLYCAASTIVETDAWKAIQATDQSNKFTEAK